MSGEVLVRTLDIRAAGGSAIVAVVTFVCMPDAAPVLSLLFEPERIAHDDWTALKRQVDEAWRELAVWCACEDPFWLHAADSPHGCQRKGCECSVFRARAANTRRIEG